MSQPVNDDLSPKTPFGINLGAGAATMIVAVGVAALVAPMPARLAIVAAAVAAYTSLAGDLRAALATAGLGFLLFTGFLVNRYGQLTFGGAVSVVQAGVLAAAVGLGAAHRWAYRARHRAAMWRELEDFLQRLSWR